MIHNVIKIYCLLILLKLIFLDKIDRIALINSFYYSTSSSKKYFHKLLLDKFKKFYYLLYLPFYDNNYLITHTSGSIYTTYVFRYYPKLAKNLDNKYYWYKIFKKYNINHPNIVALNYKNKSKILENNYDKSKKYIFKPIFGEQGYDVKLIKGSNIKYYLKNHKNFLIQQLLKDCFKKQTRHFRYVSLYNGKSFLLNESVSSNDVLISNTALGSYRYCRGLDFNIDKCNLSKMENKQLTSIITKLNSLHKKKFNKVFVICWDIMLDCKNKNNVKAYCLEGNNFGSAWKHKTVNKKVVKIYKKKAIKFYKKMNLM